MNETIAERIQSGRKERNRSNVMAAVLVLAIIVLILLGLFYLLDRGTVVNNNSTINNSTYVSQPVVQSESIYNTIQNDSSLSVYAQSILGTELASNLNSGNEVYTVFVPSDSAFSVAALPTTELGLRNILNYHVLTGEVSGIELLNLDNQSLQALNGQTVLVDIRGGEIYINNSKVIIRDIEASNGVIHVIDAVLIPEI
jgi:uncharacterized surface protein with fasciclin (FAS1) repeats